MTADDPFATHAARLYLPAVRGGDDDDGGATDGGARTAQVRNGGTVIKYDHFGDQRVAMDRAGEFRYLHGDHLGGIAAETGLDARIRGYQAYNAYGSQRRRWGQPRSEHKFTGHHFTRQKRH